MPVQNNAYLILRDYAITVVNSIGFGSSDAVDGAGPSYPIDRLGGGDGSNNAAGQPNDQSWWKTAGDVTLTTGGDETPNPWFQLEATWGATEISTDPSDAIALFESGLSLGALAGLNPAGNDGTNIFARSFLYQQTKTQNSAKTLRERVDF